MEITPIGTIVLVACLICLIAKKEISVYTLVLSNLLGAASAINLGGSGQVQPAHLVLIAVTARVLGSSDNLNYAITLLEFPKTAFWLLLFITICVISAFFYPRLFSGNTIIFAVGRTEEGPTSILSPLSPTSGNFTQSIYIICDFICFITILAIASSSKGLIVLAKAIILCACLNFVFAFLDLITYYTNTGFLLEPIRNTGYALHVEEEIGGLKRIAGSFTETSSFSGFTLALLSFSATLMIHGRWTSVTLPLTLINLLMLLASTSTTAVVTLPIVFLIVYATALSLIRSRRESRAATRFSVFAPLFFLSAIFMILANNQASSVVSYFLDILIFSKEDSQSGQERGQWNSSAIQNFYDTYGFGAGLGSVKASSFPVALISNVGVAGAFAFSIFMIRVLLRSHSSFDSEFDIKIAARNVCLTSLFSALLIGTLVDFGLMFYVFAAIACGSDSSRKNIL